MKIERVFTEQVDMEHQDERVLCFELAELFANIGQTMQTEGDAPEKVTWAGVKLETRTVEAECTCPETWGPHEGKCPVSQPPKQERILHITVKTEREA